jgi:putative two-component system response regulator
MKSILIVDDNLVSLKQISTQLEGSYEVLLAKSGELALQICSQEKPDLILLDVEMPEMNGFETIARLKADPEMCQIPVLFLTGNRDSATEIKCLESGAMDFITKPIVADILRHRIELHLQFSAYQHHLENTVKELEDNIGISFAELVEGKDYNIAGHVLRSGKLSEALAQKLFEDGTFAGELLPGDIGILGRAAPFHDVGKIGISDIILLKQGKLIESEYREVQRHTLIGEKMMDVIYNRTPNQRYLKIASQIAGGHHECFDGTGYPRGLSGDAIPLCCRIMAVANVYDACVTDRVYRKGFSHEETCRMIFEGRGSKFDPRIVDAFGQIREQFALLYTGSQFVSKESDWRFCHETNTGS